jgi:hypothetical protein
MLTEDSKTILNKLFYEEKLGAGKKADFIKKVKEKYPKITINDIKEFMNNQEMNQINSKINQSYEYKITAPPRTFQIDIFWWRKGETLIPILLFVDILSRKAYSYIIPKGKQETRGERTFKIIKQFINDIGKVNGLEGDNEFSNKQLKEFCNENNIRLDTSVSKEEHISDGNKLGIIDRLVRTLRELIERYYDVKGDLMDPLKKVLESVVDTYNNNGHRSLHNKTPNEVFNDNNSQISKHLLDSIHNEKVYKTVPFKSGDNVRILEEKGKFDKGSSKFSRDLYTIDNKEGYKLRVKNASGEMTKRKLKPSEIKKVNTIDNPKPQAKIDRAIKIKDSIKTTNKLIRNEDMTVEEAKKAKKALKNNNLSPALSTRSSTRQTRTPTKPTGFYKV